MVDDIGLGNVVANMIYLIISTVGIIGAWFFIKKKNKIGIIFWISLVLNFLSFLYFMGSYMFYPDYFNLIINNYWPWLNLGLFVLLIIDFIKNKNENEKTKKGNNIN